MCYTCFNADSENASKGNYLEVGIGEIYDYGATKVAPPTLLRSIAEADKLGDEAPAWSTGLPNALSMKL